jgi:4-diphosphocytidyl-2-C-methyl-D-erythritol kinase
MTSLKLNCPAKVNIFLRVVGKRVDGYHELESFFALTDLNDVLEVKKSSDFEVLVDGEFAQFVDPASNLLTKIAQYFQDEFLVDLALKVRLTKNIPVGSGLGGGSSNAAFFIVALNEIYQLGLSRQKMAQISLKFGSDIAFFFEESPAFVFGRGEDVKKVKQSRVFDSLIVHPKVALSTKKIFENISENFSKKIGYEKLSKATFEELIKIPNDLQIGAENQMSIIRELISFLSGNGAKYSKMTGSGSACFGIFDDEDGVNIAAKKFEKNFPNFFATKAKVFV